MKRVCVLVSVIAVALVHGLGHAGDRGLYDARVLGTVPEGDPGYIEGIAYDGTDVYAGTASGLTGTAVPATSLGLPSRIFAWERTTGTPRSPIVVEGEDTSQEHAIVGLKFDDKGRLLALSNQLGLLRFARKQGEWQQRTIAPLPDIPPCAIAGPPCSPTPTDRPPFGNDMTWDADGNLYISDSFQATIWKLTPGGELTPWFQSERLERLFGANGLRVGPDGSFMAIAITGPDSAEAGPIQRGSRVIAVPFPDPSAGDIVDLLVMPLGSTTDGIAYGAAGDLYVLSNSTNEIYVVATDGSVTIVGNDDLSGDAVMDFPASLVFDGDGALLIANYAYVDGLTPLGSRTVIDVWIDDEGMPEPPVS